MLHQGRILCGEVQWASQKTQDETPTLKKALFDFFKKWIMVGNEMPWYLNSIGYLFFKLLQ